MVEMRKLKVGKDTIVNYAEVRALEMLYPEPMSEEDLEVQRDLAFDYLISVPEAKLKEILLRWFEFHTKKIGESVVFTKDELKNVLWYLFEGQYGSGVYSLGNQMSYLFDIREIIKDEAREFFE